MLSVTARSFARCEFADCASHAVLPSGFARARGSLVAMLLSAAAMGQIQALGPPSQATSATVYRDTNGMPHIVADNEATAWYALGYEQARDGLLFIQFACKAAKGELTWARGLSGLTSDFAVKAFNTHGRLAAMTVPLRQALFAPTNPSIQANFYDNCVAFATGANAYRQAVENAPATPLTPERQLRNWLSSNALMANGQSQGQTTLAWVYQHPIEPLDIAAQGALAAALMSFWWSGGRVNSVGASYADLPSGFDPGEADPQPSADPLDPGHAQRWMERMRQQLSVVTGAPSAFSGSNTFAWSGLYCQDASPGTTTYAGLLGDPHQPVPSHPDFRTGFFFAPNHLWFAHVKVTPVGASQPSLDVLGHFPHAAAASFTSHNRSVGMGGTQGSPNHFDTFLLRLREAPNGTPATPQDYYSYYHDVAATNVTWQPISVANAPVKLQTNQIVNVPYWRAGSFGIILPNKEEVETWILVGAPVASQPQMPVVYGERIAPNQPAPRWRVGVPSDPQAVTEPMRFWRDPQFDSSQQLLTSPMVVALRAPIDAAVAGEDMHWQMLRDFWEMAHATQVNDVTARTNGAAFIANVCFVDRAGRTFSTQLSAIPQRGDDVQMLAKQYRTLDKWAIYNKALPVPARHSDDRMFDWRFGAWTPPGPPSQLLYLQYPTSNPPPAVIPFKPMTLQEQGTNGAFPPTSYPASGPFRIESGFFAAACNDMIWGFSRKRDILSFSSTGLGAPFNNVTVDNQLFQWALDRGCVYQTPILALEGPQTQHVVVTRFTRQAERIIRGAPAGLPPLTPAQMREFVVTPELHREESYGPPPGVTPLPNLPTPIRQLQEVVNHPSYTATVGTPPNTTLYESPLLTAQKELAFFTDLWSELFSPTSAWSNHFVVGASPAVTLSLRDLWVNSSVPAHQDQIFWYDDPVMQTGLRWIDLPPEFPLIDFFWPESDLSRGITAGMLYPSIWLGNENTTFTNLVAQLVNWDPAGAHYRNVPTSPGACLLEMMRMGYNALTVPTLGDFGRHWVRLKRGQLDHGSLTSPNWVPLTSTGTPGSGAPLLRQSKAWEGLRHLAFSGSQVTTLMRGPGTPVPYNALYVNPLTRQVRTTLSPEHTNELVKFFLALGNHYIQPQANNGNPSRKLARYQLLNGDENAFLARVPDSYPLTDGLQRLTAVRALLDTGAYLQSISPSGVPPFSQCFRARAYDHTGQIWPALPATDNPCVGVGGLRAVVWNEAPDPGNVLFRGFQPKFLGLSGSISTMVAMFPSVGQGVDSYFWCTPGLEIMTNDPQPAPRPPAAARFNAHMNAFSTNTLLPSHYDDFLNHVAWSVVHTY